MGRFPSLINKLMPYITGSHPGEAESLNYLGKSGVMFSTYEPSSEGRGHSCSNHPTPTPYSQTLTVCLLGCGVFREGRPWEEVKSAEAGVESSEAQGGHLAWGVRVPAKG